MIVTDDEQQRFLTSWCTEYADFLRKHPWYSAVQLDPYAGTTKQQHVPHALVLRPEAVASTFPQRLNRTDRLFLSAIGIGLG